MIVCFTVCPKQNTCTLFSREIDNVVCLFVLVKTDLSVSTLGVIYCTVAVQITLICLFSDHTTKKEGKKKDRKKTLGHSF